MRDLREDPLRPGALQPRPRALAQGGHDVRRRRLGRAGVEGRLRVVFDPELDALRELVAGDARGQNQAHVAARRDAGGGDDLALDDPALEGRLGAEPGELLVRGPVRGRRQPAQDPGRTDQQRAGAHGGAPMIKPYTAVGLIPTVRGIRRRKDIKLILDHLKHLVKAASWLSSLDLPVRLIAFPEGALQAFNDEVLDLDHATFARECAIDIPGEETDELGKIAKEYDAFVMAQAKAKHPDLKDRFFNVGFIINPRGKVILKHYKVSPLFPVEHSVCPHDVYDWWIEKYGRTLDAFWPVADTEIGRLGIMMANEGSYPENARALALNGAEVVYRASYPHPATGNEMFEIQSRARALDNNMFIVAPNMGTYYLFPEETTPIDTFGGRSYIIDYKGRIVGRQDYGAGSTYVAGVPDIEAILDQRARAQWDNWMKDIRCELYQLLYEKPIYPKNLYLKRAPMKHAEYREKVIKRQIRLMHDRDIWKRPDR